MAEQTVIREFLVKLGYKQDEREQKKFVEGIDNATKSVAKLVGTIQGAALAVAAGVSAFASNLEQLYFASQRIGASANSLKAADVAARDLGASSAQIGASLENLARFLRDNPGAEGFLQGLGVQTRDAKGNIKETVDLLSGLGQRLAAMPWFQAVSYARTLGIDENTLRAIRSGEFDKKLEQNRQLLRSSGFEEATKDAHLFMEQMRQLGLQFDIFLVQVEAALLHELAPDMKDFAQWFRQESPMIAQRVGEVATAIIDMAKLVGSYLKEVIDFLVDLDEKTGGWSTRLLVLLGVLRLLGAGSLIMGIFRLGEAFFKLSDGIAAANGAAGAAATLSSLVGGLAALFYSPSLNTGEDEEVKKIRGKLGLPEGGIGTNASSERAIADAWRSLQGVDRDKASLLMDYFQSVGWTKEQAAGIVGNLIAENSAFDPRQHGDWGQAVGIAQWHRPRQEDFRKWAGFSIHDAQADMLKQAEFVNYELTQGSMQKAGALLRATQNADAAGRVVSQYYEKPMDRDGSNAAMRGQIAVQLTQKTDIHVNGAADPRATAMEVANVQDGVGADMARKLNTVVQ